MVAYPGRTCYVSLMSLVQLWWLTLVVHVMSV